MLHKETFEGWYDQNPEWEFDMPIYMVKPIGGYAEAGNASGVDELIGDYQIDLSVYGKVKDYFDSCEPEQKKWVKNMFTRVKNNRARKGVYYWKRTIEWDDNNMNQKVLENITLGKDE